MKEETEEETINDRGMMTEMTNKAQNAIEMKNLKNLKRTRWN